MFLCDYGRRVEMYILWAQWGIATLHWELERSLSLTPTGQMAAHPAPGAALRGFHGFLHYSVGLDLITGP